MPKRGVHARFVGTHRRIAGFEVEDAVFAHAQSLAYGQLAQLDVVLARPGEMLKQLPYR